MQEILERMVKSMAELRAQPQYAGCVPFLYTYYLVTKNIFEHGQRSDFFQDLEAVQELDRFFAKQYFDPLSDFLNGTTEVSSPWRTFYEYAQSPHPRAFVALLLGVNAHINGDLPLALATVQYNQVDDFNKLDQVIGEVTRNVMRFLVTEYHDIQALGGALLPQLTAQEFNKMVLGWRHQAWDNAQQINPENLVAQRNSINQKTEAVAEQLVTLFQHPISSVFHRAEWHELKVII